MFSCVAIVPYGSHIPGADDFTPAVAFMAVQMYGSLSRADGVENTYGELALLADNGHLSISGGPVPVMFIIGLAFRLLISHRNHTLT